MKKISIILFLLIISLGSSAEIVSAKSSNEVSFSATVSANGRLVSASGMHTPLPGNLGTNVKKGTLNDDTLTTEDYALSVDYFRKYTDNLYLNAGITKSNMTTKDTKATFVGGYVVTPFPKFTFKGVTLDLGPSYRFNSINNLIPYVGLNASYYSGKVTDTNYPTVSGTGTYGVGGPETNVTCWGFNPNIGLFVNSGFFKGFGVVAKSNNLDCDGDSFRSFTSGYKVEIKNTLYQINYRLFF